MKDGFLYNLRFQQTAAAAEVRRYALNKEKRENKMDESSVRMTQPESSPNTSEVAEWIGDEAYKYWLQISTFIEQQYPSIFTPEWLFGGKKHGWSLRYKKSKSFCTLIPEKNRFKLQIVFGAKEREKVESVRDNLTSSTQRAYDDAKTYHDGKWLYLSINNEEVVKDIKQLLNVKRKPRKINIP